MAVAKEGEPGMHSSTAHDAQRGFTLLELMVTVAIIGILASIAIPYYFGYVQRSRIIEATTALGDMRSQMEKFYMDNRTYLSGGNCAVNTYMTAYNLVASNKFSLKAAAPCTATTYTLEADGIGPMVNFVYTINQQNIKVTVNTAWGVTSGNCWVSRQDGSCL
jgi:prepilin-type N-terminal cleavage/methylation domain-containing protein